MNQILKTLLEIQNFDIKMIRLMRIKRKRTDELQQIEALRKDLREQLSTKESEVEQVKKEILNLEKLSHELVERRKKLEAQQGSVKKVEEFNVLTQELARLERERVATEHKLSELVDAKNVEEEILGKIRESLEVSEKNSISLEKEIRESIQLINVEGSSLKAEREELSKSADPEVLRIYERLLHNKKDRVIVPIENQVCSGCHIALTVQHENVVRKGTNLTFCEHCSRIHYWQPEAEAVADTAGPKRRRRRSAS